MSPELGGTSHRLLPDMIEVGSFIGLAAMTQSEITIQGAGIEHLGIIPEKFRQLGIQMEYRGDDIYIPSLVSKTALMICRASFFAPCGMIVPFSFLPPMTSKEFMREKILRYYDIRILLRPP